MGERILLTHGSSLSNQPLFVAEEAGLFADQGLRPTRQPPCNNRRPYIETIFGRWPSLQPLGLVPGDQGPPAGVVSLNTLAGVFGQRERDEPVAATR